jgi:hypothetical protein
VSYASPDDLQPWIHYYGVSFPSDPERLLRLATADVQRHLGAMWDIGSLEVEQAQALRDATSVQAAFRIAQGTETLLGVDDGVAAVGGMSFSVRPIPRFSVEASELLAGIGLYVRSATVEPVADES